MNLLMHETVLKQAAVNALVQNSCGTFADCTYGGGGHSETILNCLSNKGRLLAIDRDAEAIAHARCRYLDEKRFIAVQGRFSQISDFVTQFKLGLLAGVLIDSGISSLQLDRADRGFSFMHDGPLDMRMDQTQGMTASEWLNSATEAHIALVIWRYSEEKFAKRIARHLVVSRQTQPIETTGQLANLVAAAVPKWQPNKHPATRTFQAIRIHINQELQELESCLISLLPLLAVSARLVVISFHSLEDRIVKRFMRTMARGGTLPAKLPITDDQIVRHLKLIGKPVKPGNAEIEHNRRARSSIMRVAEKLG